jgi:GT2 family glycosyltransferase
VPVVDVVIVSHNSASHLRGCVEPLATSPGVNVILVDNASSDGSLEAVADLPVEAVPLDENRGFAYGCNVGWRKGTAPTVLFLNPDATIDPDSLHRMSEALLASPSIGAVAPKILASDGSLDFSQRRFPRLRTTYAQALFLHRLVPRATWSDELVRDTGAYERSGSPDWASGACLLVKRELLEQLHGFDDGFFMYCEDRDLCQRIRAAGFEIRFQPQAVAIHSGGASAPRARLLPILAASRVRYAKKHQPAHVAFAERVGVALGALTHAALTTGGSEARRGHLRAFRQTVSPQSARTATNGRPPDA